MVSGANRSNGGDKGHQQLHRNNHTNTHRNGHARGRRAPRLTTVLLGASLFQAARTVFNSTPPTTTQSPLIPTRPSQLHNTTGQIASSLPNATTLGSLTTQPSPAPLAPSQAPSQRDEEIDTQAPSQSPTQRQTRETPAPTHTKKGKVRNPSLRGSLKTTDTDGQKKTSFLKGLRVANARKSTHVPAPIDLKEFPFLKNLADSDPELSEKLHILDFLIIEKSLVTGRPIDQLRSDIFEALQTASEEILHVEESSGNTTDGHNRRLQGVPAVVELTQDTIDSLAIAFGREFLQTSVATLQQFLANTNLPDVPGRGPIIDPLDPTDPNPPTFEEIAGTAVTRVGVQILENFGIPTTQVANSTNTVLDITSALNSPVLASAVNNIGEAARQVNNTEVAAAANKLSAVFSAVNQQQLTQTVDNLSLLGSAFNATSATQALDNLSAVGASINPEDFSEAANSAATFVKTLNVTELAEALNIVGTFANGLDQPALTSAGNKLITIGDNLNATQINAAIDTLTSPESLAAVENLLTLGSSFNATKAAAALDKLSDVAADIDPKDVSKTLGNTRKLTDFLAALVSTNETEASGAAKVVQTRVREVVGAAVSEGTSNATRAEITALLKDQQFITALGQAIGQALFQAANQTLHDGGIEILYDGVNTVIQNPERLASTTESISKVSTAVARAFQSPEVIGNFTEAVTSGLEGLDESEEFKFAAGNITNFVIDTLADQGLTTLTKPGNIARFKNITEALVGSAFTAAGDNIDALLETALNSTFEFIQKNETQQIVIDVATTTLHNFINDPGTQDVIRDLVNVTLTEGFDKAGEFLDTTFTKADAFVDRSLDKATTRIYQNTPLVLAEAVVTLYILYKLIRIFDQKVLGRCNLDEGNLAGRDAARGANAFGTSDANGLDEIGGAVAGGAIRGAAQNRNHLTAVTRTGVGAAIRKIHDRRAQVGDISRTAVSSGVKGALDAIGDPANAPNLQRAIGVITTQLLTAIGNGDQALFNNISDRLVNSLVQAAANVDQGQLNTLTGNLLNSIIEAGSNVNVDHVTQALTRIFQATENATNGDANQQRLNNIANSFAAAATSTLTAARISIVLEAALRAAADTTSRPEVSGQVSRTSQNLFTAVLEGLSRNPSQQQLRTFLDGSFNSALRALNTAQNTAQINILVNTLVDRALAQFAEDGNQAHLTTTVNTLVNGVLANVRTNESLNAIQAIGSGLARRFAADFRDANTRQQVQDTIQALGGDLLSVEVVPARNGRPAVTMQTFLERLDDITRTSKNASKQAAGAGRFASVGVILAAAVLLTVPDLRTAMGIITGGAGIGALSIFAGHNLPDEVMEALGNPIPEMG